MEPEYPREVENKAVRKKLVPSFELQSRVFEDALPAHSPARKYPPHRLHLVGPELKRNQMSPDNTMARGNRMVYSPPQNSARA